MRDLLPPALGLGQVLVVRDRQDNAANGAAELRIGFLRRGFPVLHHVVQQRAQNTLGSRTPA
ncbi:MAG TPA: hypothetical protein VFP70_07290 [Burkholderiales bacterium]|nr:hypothetical protein [Burkholderiales bacterium]